MEQSLLPNIYAFLSNIDPFETLDDASLHQLAAKVDILYLTKNQHLLSEDIVGNGLYLVRTGAIEQLNFDGSLRAKLAEKDVFGFSQMYKKSNGNYNVVAIENTLLYKIPQTTLIEFINDSPSFKTHFADQESVRLSSYTTSRESLEDNFYWQSVDSVMNHSLAIVSKDTPIFDVANTMVDRHRSTALVMEDKQLVGVITDRDMTKRVVSKQLDVTQPISSIMTCAPKMIRHDATVVEAIGEMMQHNVRSLPVVKENEVVGVLTATSLVEGSQVQAVFLISRIYRQESVAGLKSLVNQKYAVFDTLVETKVHPRTIQHMMTLIADSFNKRLLQLAERELGRAPMKYAWMAAGSQARKEVHNLSDQDNGLVLERDPTNSELLYFKQLAEFVCHGLNSCGYALCTGNLMAMNPNWCVSLDQWRHYYSRWIKFPETEALLNISVFLDVRFLYGDHTLIESLKAHFYSLVKSDHRLVSVLTANSLRVNPPLGMFKQFVLSKDGANKNVLNIKKHAVNLLVELTRIYALAAGSVNTEIVMRLDDAVDAGVLTKADMVELLESFDFINQVRFNHQYKFARYKVKMSNDISPTIMSQFERNHLKDAFRIIARFQESVSRRFNAGGMLR